MDSTALAEAPSIEKEVIHEERARLSKKSEEDYPGAGWTFYQWWRELNGELFGRQMKPLPIQFEPTDTRRFGLWKENENRIVLDISVLRKDGSRWWPHHRTFGHQFPRDVLLRQMTLQYIETIRGEEVCGPEGFPVESLSENRWWIREINRLTQEMDLGGRLPSSKEESDWHLTRKEVEWWPYSIRPEGHYDRNWTDVLGEEE